MKDILRIAIDEIDFRLNILKERASALSEYDPIECIKQHGNIEMEMKYCQNISANFNVHCRTIKSFCIALEDMLDERNKV